MREGGTLLSLGVISFKHSIIYLVRTGLRGNKSGIYDAIFLESAFTREKIYRRVAQLALIIEINS